MLNFSWHVTTFVHFVRSISFDFFLFRSISFDFVSLRQYAIAALYTPQFGHISSANLLSVPFRNVYSGFFIFSPINRKRVFL